MRIGLSYRSEVKYHMTGDVSLQSDGSAAGNALLAGLVGAGYQSKLKSTVSLPGTFIISVAQQLSDRWEMLGDISRTGWSSINNFDIDHSSGLRDGQRAQRIDADFRDAWRIAFGANYKYNDQWKLKYGIAYDQTPVKRSSTRMTQLPDNDRVWLSFGTQWTPNKASRLDLGLAYVFIRDAYRQQRLYKIYDGNPPVEIIQQMQGLDEKGFDPEELLDQQHQWEKQQPGQVKQQP